MENLKKEFEQIQYLSIISDWVMCVFFSLLVLFAKSF